MKKKSLSNRSEIISILLILMVAFSLILKVISNDLFFDLKTGESILKHGVDFKDHFSFIPNLTYIYHHWFYDLIVLGIYKYFRWHGLFILFLLMYSLFGISLFFVNKNYSNKFIATIVAIYTMIITAYAFQFRVQSISYLLFFWEVCILEKLYKTGNKKYSFFLVIISIIIVNIHMPLWILCLILFLPYLVESLLCLISKKHTSLECMMFLEQPKNTKLLIITFFILVFTGFISPLKLYPYIFFSKSLFNDSFLFIIEMAKPALYDYKFEVVLLLFIIFGLYFKILKLSLRDFLLLTGLFIFSLIAVRNIVFFSIFTPTIYIKSLSFNFKLFNGKTIKYITKKINFKVVSIFTIMLLLCSYAIFFIDFFNDNPDYKQKAIYPDKIVKYILKECDYKNIILYTDFGFGSYPAFYDIPIFVDSRAEVYIKEYNGGYDIISDYKDSNNFKTYKKVLTKYNFDYLIVDHESNLYYFLKEDKNYALILTENDDIKYSLFKRI